MMTVASPAMSLTKHSIAVDLPSPGGPDSKRALHAQSFRLQHVAVADRSGEKVKFRARLLMRNDIFPGSLRHARADGAQIAIDQHDSTLEWIRFLQQFSHQGNHGGFVQLAIDQSDAVAQLARPVISLHDEHEVTVTFGHCAAKDGARPDHLKLAVDIRVIRWQRDCAWLAAVAKDSEQCW